jgi:hypothetical protein
VVLDSFALEMEPDAQLSGTRGVMGGGRGA